MPGGTSWGAGRNFRSQNSLWAAWLAVAVAAMAAFLPTLMNSDENKTIPAALAGFISSFSIDWGAMSAAAVLTVVSTLAIFAFASRWGVSMNAPTPRKVRERWPKHPER